MTQFVYLSNALSGTISCYKLEHDRLVHLGDTNVGDMVMPMAVSHCQQYLYAAVRRDPFRLIQFHIDHETGNLIKWVERPSEVSFVNLETDIKDEWLACASFDQNSVALHSLSSDGEVSTKLLTFHSDGHCHQFKFSPSGQWLVASEFGQDRIHVFARPTQDGILGLSICNYDFRQGSGPRHMVFSHCGGFLYVLCEMSAQVVTFSFDANEGKIKLLDETEALPLKQLGLSQGLPPAKRVDNDIARAWAADIHLSENGRFLYVSERTLSVIACLEFEVESALPRYIHHHAVERQPRSFALTKDGRHLLVSGELADQLGLYHIDATTGSLNRMSSAHCGQGSAWVSVVEQIG